VTRYRDPERAKGNLPEGQTLPGEFVPPPQLEQYQARLIETFPFQLYSQDEIWAAHCQRNEVLLAGVSRVGYDAPAARPARPSAGFRRSSLRRG
jgi:hypothetical protein